MKTLVEVYFPKAEVIRVVVDNLNTHIFGALYETFPPEEARRIAKRLEFHYTPKHGSWLNMAEMEFSVLTRQCLNRRLDTAEGLAAEIAAWESRRNDARTTIDWTLSAAGPGRRGVGGAPAAAGPAPAPAPPPGAGRYRGLPAAAGAAVPRRRRARVAACALPTGGRPEGPARPLAQLDAGKALV